MDILLKVVILVILGIFHMNYNSSIDGSDVFLRWSKTMSTWFVNNQRNI